MTDRNHVDDESADRFAREQTLARLMEAAATLATARVEPGDGNDSVEANYQCCLSIVMHEYQRMLVYGFADDPAKAALAYATGLEGMTGFTPA